MIESTTTGNTPLDPDEAEGLIPGYVSDLDELNYVEQINILEAVKWASGRRNSNLLTDTFVRELHRRMLENVWRWAGSYRNTLKNIGVPPELISVEVRKLCDDTKFQIEHSISNWDEFGIRFHHRLVCIHPFSNGNGRHARIMTDLILEANGQNPFLWGAHSPGGEIRHTGASHDIYISALRMADKGDFGPLLSFARG